MVSTRRAYAAACSKRVDVDLCREVEHTVARLDRSGSESAPGDVHSLVEVVGGGGGVETAPEHVHRLLAMEAVLGGECEQLHQLARLLQPPDRAWYVDSVDGGRKTAEER